MKCKQATRLMSETLDRTLAPLEGFQLKLHLVPASAAATTAGKSAFCVAPARRCLGR